MRNFKKATLLYIMLQILIFGCTSESKRNNTILNRDSLSKHQTLKIPNTIEQDSVYPYKHIDSIFGELKKKFNYHEVKRLDSLCLLSDGDLTELLDEQTVNLFNINIKGLSEYLIQNPRSCLKNRLIEGLGNKYSVYKKDERKLKILEDENRLINSAKKQKLNYRIIEFIKNLFRKINPNQLD